VGLTAIVGFLIVRRRWRPLNTIQKKNISRVLENAGPHKGWVSALCSIPVGDHEMIGSTGYDMCVRLWKEDIGELHCVRGTGISNVGRSLCYVDWNGKPAVAVGESAWGSARIEVINVHSGEVIKSLRGHTMAILDVTTVQYDNVQYLLSCSPDKSLLVFNLTESFQYPKSSYNVCEFIYSDRLLSVISRGNMVALSSYDNNIVLLPQLLQQVSSGKENYKDPVHFLKGHEQHVTKVRVDAHDEHMAKLYSSSSDGTVRIWDVERSECIRIIQPKTKTPIDGLAVHGVIATGSQDGFVRLWDERDGGDEPKRVIEGHTGFVLSVIFSRDGNYLYSGGKDKEIKRWELN